MSSTFGFQPPTEDDPYWKVTASPAGSPFTTTLRFAELIGDDGTKEFVLARAAIEQPSPGELNGREDFKDITAATVRDLAAHWDGLESGARAYLAVLSRDTFTSKDLLRVRTRRTLSDEFLADVMRRHAGYRAQGVSANQALAREERVSVSTVKHWLATARKRGIGTES